MLAYETPTALTLAEELEVNELNKKLVKLLRERQEIKEILRHSEGEIFSHLGFGGVVFPIDFQTSKSSCDSRKESKRALTYLQGSNAQPLVFSNISKGKHCVINPASKKLDFYESLPYHSAIKGDRVFDLTSRGQNIAMRQSRGKNNPAVGIFSAATEESNITIDLHEQFYTNRRRPFRIPDVFYSYKPLTDQQKQEKLHELLSKREAILNILYLKEKEMMDVLEIGAVFVRNDFRQERKVDTFERISRLKKPGLILISGRHHCGIKKCDNCKAKEEDIAYGDLDTLISKGISAAYHRKKITGIKRGGEGNSLSTERRIATLEPLDNLSLAIVQLIEKLLSEREIPPLF